MQELYLSLMMWAAALSGYPMPKEMPVVWPVTQEWMVNSVCEGKDCRVVAWYPDDGVVYVNQEALKNQDDRLVQSFLVHEFVHHAQHVAHPAAFTCKEEWQREVEAYTAQRKFLAAKQFYFPVGMRLPMVDCSNSEF